jgi:hypothetical protein
MSALASAKAAFMPSVRFTVSVWPGLPVITTTLPLPPSAFAIIWPTA